MGGLNINNTDNHGMIFVLKKKRSIYIKRAIIFHNWYDLHSF